MIYKNITQHIESRLGSKKAAIQFLSESLSISENAAYKRANGTTPYTLEEVVVIADSLAVSIDALLQSGNKSISFTIDALNKRDLSISNYLKRFITLAEKISLSETHIYYASNEFPLLQYFAFPRLNYFKFFMWSRTNWKQDAAINTTFSYKDSLSKHQEFYYLSREIYQAYLNIPSTEFICFNSLDNTIQQIKYFVEIGAFSNKEEAVALCDELEAFVVHLNNMAMSGKKFAPDGEWGTSSFFLYNNEIIQSNNVCLVDSAHLSRLFITLDNPNTLETDNPGLIDYTRRWFETMKKFALPLGREVEKNRLIYFNKLNSYIDNLRHFVNAQR